MVDDFSLHTDVFGLEDTHMYAMLLGTKKPRPFAGPVIASSRHRSSNCIIAA